MLTTPQAQKSNILSPEHLQFAIAQGLDVNHLTLKQLTALQSLSIEKLNSAIINGITLISYINQQVYLNRQRGQVMSENIIQPAGSSKIVIITSKIS
jgi:hypothetical protein